MNLERSETHQLDGYRGLLLRCPGISQECPSLLQGIRLLAGAPLDKWDDGEPGPSKLSDTAGDRQRDIEAGDCEIGNITLGFSDFAEVRCRRKIPHARPRAEGALS